MATQNISTNRIRLRKYFPQDAELLYELLGKDPEITKYTGWNPYATPAQAKRTVQEFMTQSEEPHFYGWAIEADGTLIGTIGAYDYNEKNRSIEIGYSIGKEYWGRGYATEAVLLVCYFLQEYENILEIHAWTRQENLASIRVLEKSGLHLDGQDGNILFYKK